MIKAKVICLEFGDKNKDVEKAQQMLQKVGSTIKVTGEFTIGMTSAVKAFQKKNGLKVTGIIDKKTWDALVAKSAKKAPAKRKTGGVKK